MNLSSCPICAIGSNGRSPAIATLFPGWPAGQEVVFETDRVRVILDAAPLEIGHVLIAPKVHSTALIEVWDELEGEISEVRQWVLNKLTSAGIKDIAECEHGSFSPTADRSCVTHAHLHVVPCRFSILKEFQSAGLYFDPINSLRLRKRLQGEYIYLRDIDGSAYVASADEFESQLFRRVYARSVGSRVWHWHDAILFAETIGTREKIQNGLRIFAPRSI